MVCRSPAGCSQASKGGHCCICESKWQLLFLLIELLMHNFKIGFNFAKHYFLNQTYVLPVFNDKESKVNLFWKINRFLRSRTSGLIHRDFIKKINNIFITRFKFCLSLYSLSKLTRTPFKRIISVNWRRCGIIT